MRSRRQSAFEEFTEGGTPLGLLWITVDQAHELRKTHGARACETMIGRVERTLTNGLRPAEELGRWGDDEFLVLSHEPSANSLAAHAQVLAGLARTSDFRWWGDRLSLTREHRRGAGNRRRRLCPSFSNVRRPQCSQAFMRAAITSHLPQRGQHVRHRRNCFGFRRGHRRIPDGERPYRSADPAGRDVDHRRSCDGNAAGGESGPHSEGHRRWT